ncbi:MAG: hypothetical protein U0T84_04390 [Chitinophagales bacterium]
MKDQFKIPQAYLETINQVFEIEKKVTQIQESNSIPRNVNRLKDLIENELFKSFASNEQSGFVYHNPIGESYTDTRTDCEATIAGTGVENLVITEVIKPIIFLKQGNFKQMVQKAVVIVESK